ncbi:MAG: S-layer homology domain-containing protein, partial [Cyanobacteria bacterium P01_F01_bin.53]
QIASGEFGVGAFGSAALQVHPSTNLITEWTGQDLAVGVSVAPFPNFPLVFTPAIRDILGEGDGDPRFVLGVGISLRDVFSVLGL